jgi:glycosyltransferase involved in cell wall biosynthesis
MSKSAVSLMFSITIPAFKVVFLKECIESVLAQSYQNFEVIIVNDHSSEDIESIVKGFDDSRLRYYVNETGFGAENVVGNWNRCLKYAIGDYIICMGDDDKLKPNCLSDFVNIINKYPDLDVYYSRTELIDENSSVIKTFDKRDERESVYEMIYHRWNGRSMFIGDYLYKAETLRKNGGFFPLPFAWGSDAISAYVAAGKKGIANTEDIGFQYRVNNQSISRNFGNIEGKIEALRQERLWFESFFSKRPSCAKDIEILDKLKKQIHLHFQKMYADDIIYGISNRPIHQSLFWLKNYRRYRLPFAFVLKNLLRGFFYSLKLQK